ncbi:MAG TPA: DNA-formamidopyrimidine glycosylase family protein [Mycobacteriales bacterium]|nr:DNA-formamidopyrimidine glycosylase family protein [Mycobacteriales bacterium]
MPEGDTVWLSAKRMHEALAGRVLTRSDFRVPQLAATDLAGREVLSVVPRGKHMLTRIEGGLSLHTHFRMDGTWHLYRPGDRWTGGADWQVRVVLENAHWQAVGYRLPVVELLPTSEEHRAVGHLGPDLLDEAFDEAEAVRRLAADPAREVGMALLDQRLLAGLGNLYRCELLFLRGVSPWTRVADVADLPALVRTGRRLMRANREHWEQTTTGSLRRGEDHWVFERTGRPCRRCRTRVVSAEQSDPGAPAYARLTYWCRHCQPGPSPAGESARAPRPVGRTRYRP